MPGLLAPEAYLEAVLEAMSSHVPRLAAPMDEVAALCEKSLSHGGSLLLAGNGGACALLSHFGSEVMSRPGRTRLAVRCVDLTGNAALVTAAANDFGQQASLERVVARVAREDDVLLLASYSGESPNLVAAAEAATAAGTAVVSLLGTARCALATRSDLTYAVPSPAAEVAQDVFMVALHLLSLLLHGRLRS